MIEQYIEIQNLILGYYINEIEFNANSLRKYINNIEETREYKIEFKIYLEYPYNSVGGITIEVLLMHKLTGCNEIIGNIIVNCLDDKGDIKNNERLSIIRIIKVMNKYGF